MAKTRPKQAISNIIKKEPFYKPQDHPKLSNRYQQGRRIDKNKVHDRVY
jgi:hypothetical protein